MARPALLALSMLLFLPPLVRAGQADARHGAASAGADTDLPPAGPKVVEEGVFPKSIFRS